MCSAAWNSGPITVEIPDKVIKTFPGPAYGPLGVRKKTGFAKDQPAFGTILKPTAGITPREVGALVQEVAGCPLFLFVKEDEDLYPNLDYSPVIGESGKPIGVIAVVVETSAAVRAERELRRSEAGVRASEERFQLALSAGNSIGTWDWDVVADRVVADARFASLYNVDPEFAKAGAPIAEFFSGIHPPLAS